MRLIRDRIATERNKVSKWIQEMFDVINLDFLINSFPSTSTNIFLLLIVEVITLLLPITAHNFRQQDLLH